MGSLGGGFGYHGCRDLVFCDYCGVVYDYDGWAEILRIGFGGCKWIDAEVAKSPEIFKLSC